MAKKTRTVKVVTMQDRRLATRKGHTFIFKRNQPKSIPRSCLEDAMAIGAAPVDDRDLPEQETPVPKGPETSEERRELIMMALDTMHTRQERNDFTAHGAPALEVLRKESGIDNIHGEERDQMYAEYLESQSEDGGGDGDGGDGGKD